jgi:hypothetical protein
MTVSRKHGEDVLVMPLKKALEMVPLAGHLRARILRRCHQIFAQTRQNETIGLGKCVGTEFGIGLLGNGFRDVTRSHRRNYFKVVFKRRESFRGRAS